MPAFPPRSHLSRRSFLATLGAVGTVGLSGGLSACSTPLGAGLTGSQVNPGTVTFWNLFGGGDGARLLLMMDEYRKAMGGPGSLEAATFAWGNPYYTKVSLASLSGNPPDVAISHLTREMNLAEAGLLAEITDDVLAAGGLKSSDFNQTAWEAQKVDGKSYCIPLDIHPFVLYYESNICQKAGLLNSDGTLKPIEGTDAFISALKAIKDVTGEYGIAIPTIADAATCWRWFFTLYSQMDGNTPFISDGGTKLTVNEDLAAKTLDFIGSLTKDGLAPRNTDYAGAQTLLFTGKAGMYLMGPWEITTFQAVEDLKFGMAPIPKLYDQKATQGDSHTFILPRKDRSPEQLKLAMGFVKNLLDQSMTWAKGGHISTYLPIFDSAEYGALKPQANYAEVADYVHYDPPAWYSGSGSNFENIIGGQIGLVAQGLATTSQALDGIKAQLKTYLETVSPL